jgi:multiple sugar transport system permease protein
LLLIAVFFFLPVLAALLLSFTDFDIYALGDLHRLRFVGLANYGQLLQSPLFWTALGNTLLFRGGGRAVVGCGLAGRGAAGQLAPDPLSRPLPHRVLSAGRDHAGRGGGGMALSLPSPLWLAELRPESGLVSNLSTGWAIRIWAMPAIILMAVWKNFGFNMIIFIAGLQNIPPQLYEAARIDGASAWRQFRYITLPLLGPTFLFVALMTMIGYFQVFAEPYVMTQGGPPIAPQRGAADVRGRLPLVEHRLCLGGGVCAVRADSSRPGLTLCRGLRSTSQLK